MISGNAYRAVIRFLPVILFFVSSAAFAGDTMVPAEASSSVSMAVLSGDYGLAEQRADDFIKQYPRQPAGYLFKASVLHCVNIDYEDFSRSDDFFALLDYAEKLARNKLAEDSADLWAAYYIHAADGLRAAWSSAEGRFFYSLAKGRSGAMGMIDLIEKDPELYDAYLMAGTYRFWKSYAVRPLVRLPLIGDERSRGIEDVRKAIEHGYFTGPLSNTALIEIYIKHDPEKALELAEKMTAAYPDCRLFRWQLGESHKVLEQYDEAVEVFTALADTFRSDLRDDGSGALRCWWKLAVLSKDVGKKEKVCYYCRKILDLAERDSVAKRQQERIGEAGELLESCE